MYLFVCILLFVYQCEACLDLMVRILNELFTPVIEAVDERQANRHNVDELGHYYTGDEDGASVLDDKIWIPPYQYWREEGEAGSLLKQFDQQPAQTKSNEPASTENSSDEGDNVLNMEAKFYPSLDEDLELDDDTNLNFGDNYREEPRRYARGYIPGKRPLVDLLMKLLEVFQPTVQPRYTASRLEYLQKSFSNVPGTRNTTEV